MTYIYDMEINYGIFSHLLLLIPKNKRDFFALLEAYTPHFLRNQWSNFDSLFISTPIEFGKITVTTTMNLYSGKNTLLISSQKEDN